MASNAMPNFAFFLMLSLSACIATFGLISNSAPAIIGAMIVAPMMSPIIALSFAMAVWQVEIILASLVSILFGLALVIAIAFVCTLIFDFSIAGSEILARRLQNDAGADTPSQIGRAFSLLYARSPIPAEIDDATRFINSQGTEAFCRAMLNTNEFLFVF